MKVTLSVVAGSAKGQRFSFEEHDAFILGRAPDCHCVVSGDPYLSRHQFLLEVNPPDLALRDLGSLNGTYVNGVKHGGREDDEDPAEAAKRNQSVELHPGDRVKVGETVITVLVEADPNCIECGAVVPAPDRKVSELIGGSYLCLACRKKVEERQARPEPRPAAAAAAPRRPAVPAPVPQRAGEGRCTRCGKSYALDSPSALLGICPACQKAAEERPAEVLGELLRQALGVKQEAQTPAIPGYQILRELGRGGFGAVWLATQEKTGRQVALKTMLQSRRPTPQQSAQFEREMDVMTVLQHPNLVTIFDRGRQGQIHYFALEYMEGGSVWDVMQQRGKLPWPTVRPLMLQSLDGLAHAHQQGFIHRDLKPPNILLTGTPDAWTAKVSDFGLAKSFTRAGMTKGNITMGGFAGTPPYMAPEHITNYRFVKPSTDVFEMAATFYHVVTGTIVWDLPRGGEPYKAILEGAIQPIARRAPDLPKAVAEVFDRALRRDPAQRHRDGGEFLKALKAAP